MAIRRTVALIAFAALVAGAFSISCYTTGSVVTSNGRTAATWPQTADTPAGTFMSCLSYSVSGRGSFNNLLVSASGRDGDGSGCTCAQWASSTGCSGETQAQATALVQAFWTNGFMSVLSTGVATVSNFACCEANNCNSGLGITLSSAALPVVNVFTLLAAAVMGVIFTAKLV